MRVEGSGIQYMTSGKKWVSRESSLNDKQPTRPMRIIETVYAVQSEGGRYEVKMTQIKGLKIRELVHVKKQPAKAKAPAESERSCSSENTSTL